MPAADPNWTDVLQTVFLGGQLALLLAAAIFGWRQLSEAKQLREEQTRPFVVIDLGSTRPKFFDLVIKNIGATMARDVRFKFDPPAESTIPEAAHDRLKMFREGISTLPPGKEIRALFDAGPARHDAGLPDLYEVTVTYRDHSGRKEYEDRIDLDFGLYWNRVYITVRDVHDLHKQLDGIRQEIKKWTANIGGGLLQVTPADLEARIEDLKRQFEERQQEEEDE